MNVYRIFPSEVPHRFLVPADRKTGELCRTLPQLDSEATVGQLSVKLITRNQGLELAATDFPWFESNVPAYSERAFAALAPVLERHGRPFELHTQTGEIFVGLRVDHVVDALDP